MRTEGQHRQRFTHPRDVLPCSQLSSANISSAQLSSALISDPGRSLVMFNQHQRVPSRRAREPINVVGPGDIKASRIENKLGWQARYALSESERYSDSAHLPGAFRCRQRGPRRRGGQSSTGCTTRAGREPLHHRSRRDRSGPRQEFTSPSAEPVRAHTAGG